MRQAAKPPAAGTPKPKPVRRVGSSREDLIGFPEDVRRGVGFALWEAQIGGKAAYAKPLKGFGVAGVVEIADDHDGDTYRAVYTVRVCRRGLCAPCLPEEVQVRAGDT